MNRLQGPTDTAVQLFSVAPFPDPSEVFFLPNIPLSGAQHILHRKNARISLVVNTVAAQKEIVPRPD